MRQILKPFNDFTLLIQELPKGAQNVRIIHDGTRISWTIDNRLFKTYIPEGFQPPNLDKVKHKEILADLLLALSEAELLEVKEKFKAFTFLIKLT